MADVSHSERRSASRHWILIVLIVGTAIVDVHRLSYLARYLSGGIALVPAPITAVEGTAAIDTVRPEAVAAGLRPGDTIVSVAGRPYTGSAILFQEIQSAKPGDVLEISVRRASSPGTTGAPEAVRVTLVAKQLAPTDRWFVLLSIFLVLPIGSQIVGFRAVRSRTWDTQAWLALALCLSVGQLLYLGDEYRDGTLLSDISLVYKEIFGTTFAVWLLLYARNFSPKLPIETRLEWVRWMVIAPVAFVSLRNIVVRLDDLHGAAWHSPLPFLTQYAALAPRIWPGVTLAAIVLFFLAMAGKCLAPGFGHDARRRLRLFFIGASASILPTLTLIVVARSTGRVLDEFHPLLLLPALLSTLLFPVTIAYVSVVHRAPEVHEVVRRGLWRTTSREALTAVQLALIVAVAVLAFSANRPELIAAAQKAIVILAILMIALQPSFVDRLRGWADRRFFKEAWRVDQALTLVDDLLGGVWERAEFGARLERLLSEALASNHVTALVARADGLYPAATGEADRAADDGAAGGGERRGPSPMFRLDGALARHLARDPDLRLVYFDQEDSWVHQLPRDEQERLRALHAQVLVPLVARDGLRGAITLGAKPYDRPYSDAELVLLSAVARHATLALRNAELVERVSADAINRERLRSERDAAEKANTAKSAFLASMSHELRTPMNAIIGYSEMLVETLSDEDQSEIAADLRKIHFAGKHLLEVINAVLDISKIEAGKMEVFHQVFPIDEMVQNVIEISQPLVMKQHNTLVIGKHDDLGLIESDRMKLRQCLFNLVSNAAKFTERGVITLSVTREWHGDQEWVLFAVKDTGIGMTPEEVARVFDAFAQAGPQVASKYGGSGLGLTITARFCELLGGSVMAESSYGAGSTFTIRLPAVQPVMRPAEEPHGDAEPGDAVAGGHAATVLIVDDDPSVHELVRRALSRRDIQVLVARTGEQGLALARRYRPQAIILDVIMQRMDGWHVLARLKVDPELRGIPVIMLSITDNRSAGFAMGATEYLVKPVELDRLSAILSKYCPAPAPAGALARSAAGGGNA